MKAKYISLTLFLGLSFSSYCQVTFESQPNDLRYYPYAPQMNNEVLRQALQYKQQIYQQRLEAIKQHDDYCNITIPQIKNDALRTSYVNTYNQTGITIGQTDLTIDSNYYQILKWYKDFEQNVNNILANQ